VDEEWEENKENRFVEEVGIKQWPAIFAVAMHIHAKGYRAVLINPKRVSEDFTEHDASGDDVDLLVQNVGHSKWWTVEVKHRQVDFTDASDFPFKEGTVMLDRVKKAERARPDAYYIVNKKITHAARVSWDSKPHWIVKTRQDDKKGYDVTAYECPLEYVRWVVL